MSGKDKSFKRGDKLSKTHPKLAEQWDYENNPSEISPETITRSYRKQVNWICSKKHRWPESPSNRARNHPDGSCPICDDRRFAEGVNDLATRYPEIALQFDCDANKETPNQVFFKSSEKKQWLCQRGHWWSAVVGNRTLQGQGCPFCANKKVWLGDDDPGRRNDLLFRYPDLAKQWNYEKNGAVTPRMVLPGCNEGYEWKCPVCGHEWKVSPNSRTNNPSYGRNISGCPCCSNKVTVSGINDLATTHPDLAIEWDYELNGDLKPTDVTRGHDKDVWWKCERGHFFPASPHTRTGMKTGCRYCSNDRVWMEDDDPKRRNDLEFCYPDIAAEWNYEKNGTVTPRAILPGHASDCYWICSACGKEYPCKPSARTSRNQGCPRCSKYLHTSLPEAAVAFYLGLSDINASLNTRSPDGIADWPSEYELDIYARIPRSKGSVTPKTELLLAIEYDGARWHCGEKNVSRDKRKAALCSERGITLVRLREPGCPKLDDDSIVISLEKADDKRSLTAGIIELFHFLNRECGVRIPDIDCNRDAVRISAFRGGSVQRQSLEELYPNIAAEWDYEENGDLKPSMVTPGSGRTVAWKHWDPVHAVYHKWEAEVVSRTAQNSGCTICSGKKVMVGVNDLASNYPEIAAEWDYERNPPDLTPEKVTKGSGINVMWRHVIDGKEHSWPDTVTHRTGMGTGCSICSNRRLLQGFNDFATRYPDLVSDWDYEENRDIDPPTNFITKRRTTVSWKCHKCGHKWKAQINSRIKNPSCPSCRKKGC